MITFEDAVILAKREGLEIDRVCKYRTGEFWVALRQIDEPFNCDNAWNPKLWSAEFSLPDSIVASVHRWIERDKQRWAPFVAALKDAMEARS